MALTGVARSTSRPPATRPSLAREVSSSPGSLSSSSQMDQVCISMCGTFGAILDTGLFEGHKRAYWKLLNSRMRSIGQTPVPCGPPSLGGCGTGMTLKRPQRGGHVILVTVLLLVSGSYRLAHLRTSRYWGCSPPIHRSAGLQVPIHRSAGLQPPSTARLGLQAPIHCSAGVTGPHPPLEDLDLSGV